MRKEEEWKIRRVKNGLLLKTSWDEEVEGKDDDEWKSEEVYYEKPDELVEALQQKLHDLT